MLFEKCYFFCSYFHLFLESHTSSTVCHFLFFVLNALLSLQTKDNHFRASALQQHFNWRDFAGNAEEQKWIRFGIGYLIFFCVASTFCTAHTDPNSRACVVINLFEHVYLFSRRICLVSCWSSDIKSINGKSFFACQNIQKLSMFKSLTTTDFLLERVS